MMNLLKKDLLNPNDSKKNNQYNPVIDDCEDYINLDFEDVVIDIDDNFNFDE